MRRVEDPEKVPTLSRDGAVVLPLPSFLARYFKVGVGAWFRVSAKRLKRGHIVIVFREVKRAPLPSPRDPTPLPPLTSTIRGGKSGRSARRGARRAKRVDGNTERALELLYSSDLMKKRRVTKVFEPDWFG